MVNTHILEVKFDKWMDKKIDVITIGIKVSGKLLDINRFQMVIRNNLRLSLPKDRYLWPFKVITIPSNTTDMVLLPQKNAVPCPTLAL